MLTDEEIDSKNSQYIHLSPEEILQDASNLFPGRVVFSSSLGLEDQAITHIIAKSGLPIQIFTLDTGRLFEKTYELIDRTESMYGIKIRLLFPDRESVENLVQESGVNCFYESVEARIRCCHVRKIEPLQRALAEGDAWISGLRRGQSAYRSTAPFIEQDTVNAKIKINPILPWSMEDLRDFIKKNRIPYNPLHDSGYPSIGCAPCTRAVEPGEDSRSGRWWWENGNRECGLHLKHGEEPLEKRASERTAAR